MGADCSSCTKGEVEEKYVSDASPCANSDPLFFDELKARQSDASDAKARTSGRRSSRRTVRLEEGAEVQLIPGREPELPISAQEFRVLNVLHLTDFPCEDNHGVYHVSFSFDENISPCMYPYSTTQVGHLAVDGLERVTFLQDIHIRVSSRSLRVAVFRDDVHIGIAKFRPDHPMLKIERVPWIAVTDVNGDNEIGYLKVRCDIPVGSKFSTDISDDEEEESL